MTIVTIAAATTTANDHDETMNAADRKQDESR